VVWFFELICVSWAKHALLPFCESLIVEALKTRVGKWEFVCRTGAHRDPSEALVKVVDRPLAMHIRGGPVRVPRLQRNQRCWLINAQDFGRGRVVHNLSILMKEPVPCSLSQIMNNSG